MAAKEAWRNSRCKEFKISISLLDNRIKCKMHRASQNAYPVHFYALLLSGIFR